MWFICSPPLTSTTCSAQEKLFNLLKTLKKGWYCTVEFCGKQLFYLERKKIHVTKKYRCHFVHKQLLLRVAMNTYVASEGMKTLRSVWTAWLEKGAICSFKSNCTTVTVTVKLIPTTSRDCRRTKNHIMLPTWKVICLFSQKAVCKSGLVAVLYTL